MKFFVGSILASLILTAALSSQQINEYEEQNKVWDWLGWSANPKHFPAGKIKLPTGHVALYYKDKPIGYLNPETGIWFSASSGLEADLKAHTKKYNPRVETKEKAAVREEDEPSKEKAPETGPEPKVIPPDGKPKFGVNSDRLHEKETFYLDGRVCSRAEAMDRLNRIRNAAGVPSDAEATRITVIGTEAQRKPVMDDLATNGALAWLKGKSIIQGYEASDQRIVDGGFVNSGTPTIYAQSPTGVVLWRQDNYEGGAEALSKALRDRVPGYDPNKDPTPKTPNKPSPDGGSSMPKISFWWIVAIAAAVFVFWRKK